jgi:glyoxylase-like metal-dependent hydrolase (beta-lactamase superfamily II)
MRVVEGVEMLEVTASSFGNPRVIYPTLLLEGEIATLVDTGYPGQIDSLRTAVEAAGVAFERIRRVILTHHDIDHIGGLASLRAALPHPLTVLAHAQEKAYIQGDQTPLKLAKLEAELAHLPEESRDFYQGMKKGFQASFSRVDETLEDGQVLPWCGGIQVIHTPGHTHGHICLYLAAHMLLVAGDALRIVNGDLCGFDPGMNHDSELCRRSLAKLAQLDVETVITYHSGLWRGAAGQRLAELGEGL